MSMKRDEAIADMAADANDLMAEGMSKQRAIDTVNARLFMRQSTLADHLTPEDLGDAAEGTQAQF